MCVAKDGRTVIVYGFFVVALFLHGETAQAGFIFDRIAYTANVFNNSGAPVAAINNDGVVAFRASLISFGDGQGVYTGSGGSLTVIAFNGHGGNVGSFGFSNVVAINDSGQVAFTSRALSDVFSATYVGSGGPLTTIATNPGPFGAQSLSFPSINNAGQVAVIASDNGFAGNRGVEVLTGSGGALTALITTTAFFPTADPTINNNGQVTFNWSGLNGFARGVYLADGATIQPILETSDPNVINLIPLNLNDEGDVVIYRQRTIGTYSILVSNEDNTRTFLTNNVTGVIPTVAINNNGTLAIDLDGAIRVGTDFVDLTHVIGIGDPLDGSTVTRLVFGRYGLNDNGEVAFYAELADGRRGIYSGTPDVAQPVPEPSTFILFGCATFGFLFVGYRTGVVGRMALPHGTT